MGEGSVSWIKFGEILCVSEGEGMEDSGNYERMFFSEGNQDVENNREEKQRTLEGMLNKKRENSVPKKREKVDRQQGGACRCNEEREERSNIC